jgi:hypothetical protein
MGTQKTQTTENGAEFVAEQLESSPQSGVRLFEERDGRDEMNLVELPLSSVSDRFLDGRKTVVFHDEIWDRQLKQRVPRKLAISGSDRYGLPTARDEDVLLACIQLSSAEDFRSREVTFSRYELLKLLRWPDESKYYRRLAISLRRWKGVTIYSDRAFYDHRRKSWVNRDFGIIDNLFLYERESASGLTSNARSWLVWNEVLFESFQAGYLKKLDWGLYCRLKSPIARRLYRWLDKRFYHANEVTVELKQLAFHKIRVSERYNTAQIKRALMQGIRELETLWDLQPAAPQSRFVKRGRGAWEVVFQRRRPPSTKAAISRESSARMDVTIELTRRGIGPAVAAELEQQHPHPTIKTMIDLFDWYRAQGQEKGPGFLVDSIRNPTKYRLPREFKSASVSPPARPERIHRKRPIDDDSQATGPGDIATAPDAFANYWAALSAADQLAFEAAAVNSAEPVKRDGYCRCRGQSGKAFEHYRQAVLRDHFVLFVESTLGSGARPHDGGESSWCGKAR